MKMLDRYIGGVVLTGTLVALVVLVGLDIFFNVIDEIDNVGKGSYTLSVMLQSVLLTTPQSLYELFPLAVLLWPPATVAWVPVFTWFPWPPAIVP